MKEIVSTAPAEIRNESARVQELFRKHVIPSYGRFELVLERGAGSFVWDVTGRKYLDLGGGIAVCCLGHAHPEISEVLAGQSKKLVHVSNLYFHEGQGRLAQAITQQVGPGKCFFCNSGAEANEGLFKLARRFGQSEGRFEILTAIDSFHGRTLAGIAATGQEKAKAGFEPIVPGFRHVPFNDLEAIQAQLSPATAAILIEGVQGEGGVTPASPEYLLGLRKICDEHGLLLLLDAVQCGYFRTGRFQSFQRILENVPEGRDFMPDGISMAKSMGSGYPIGCFWVREKYADLLGPGSHASTYGGTPLGCAVALKTLEIIQRDDLPDNARQLGAYLKAELETLQAAYPRILRGVRGLGLMIGVELAPDIATFKDQAKPPATLFTQLLQSAGVLVIPAGRQVIRLLPALNLTRNEADQGLAAIAAAATRLSS